MCSSNESNHLSDNSSPDPLDSRQFGTFSGDYSQNTPLRTWEQLEGSFIQQSHKLTARKAAPTQFRVPSISIMAVSSKLHSPSQSLVVTTPRSILKTHKQTPPKHSITLPLSETISDHFPCELVQIIIDYLHDDRAALAACSRVCRTWLSLCRVHFYAKMTIEPGNTAGFLDLVTSRHTTIGTYIRHLTIQKQTGHIDHFFILNNASCRRVPDFHFDNVLRHVKTFTSITKLSLFKGYGENPKLISHLQDFLSLEDLELRSWSFPGFSDFVGVVCAPRNLVRLSLTDIAWGTRRSLAPNLRLPPRLRHMAIFMEKQGQFFDWMLRCATQPIESLEVGGVFGPDDALACANFLRVLGPTLKHLSLYTPSRIRKVNLVYNTGLQTLYISHLQVSQWEGSGPPPRDKISEILAQLCSPNIATISLQLLMHEPEALKTIAWRQIEHTLALPRFASLETVEFRVPKCRKWALSLLEKNLPNVAARGILSVANG